MPSARKSKPTSTKSKASQRWMKERQSRPLSNKFKRVGASSAELKFKDTNKASTAITAAGSIFNDTLVGLQEGNTDSSRIGNRITVKSVMVRGIAQLAAAVDSANTSQSVRIIVYLDRQANGATAAVTDILASADFLAFNNLDNSDRFRTLADTMIDMQVPGATPSGAAYTFGEFNQTFFLKAKLNLDFKYKGNAGTVADLSGNNIGVLVIGKTDALGTIAYDARVRYTDQ